jgi:hypothetical protein
MTNSYIKFGLPFILVALLLMGLFFWRTHQMPIEPPIQKSDTSHDSLEYFYQTSQQLSNQNTNAANQDLINKLNDPDTTLK